MHGIAVIAAHYINGQLVASVDTAFNFLVVSEIYNWYWGSSAHLDYSGNAYYFGNGGMPSYSSAFGRERVQRPALHQTRNHRKFYDSV